MAQNYGKYPNFEIMNKEIEKIKFLDYKHLEDEFKEYCKQSYFRTIESYIETIKTVVPLVGLLTNRFFSPTSQTPQLLARAEEVHNGRDHYSNKLLKIANMVREFITASGGSEEDCGFRDYLRKKIPSLQTYSDNLGVAGAQPEPAASRWSNWFGG